MSTLSESQLERAAGLLFTSTDYGIAVLDPDGRVTALGGALVDGIESGEAACDAMPFLVGLEDELAAVAGATCFWKVLRPAVAITLRLANTPCPHASLSISECGSAT